MRLNGWVRLLIVLSVAWAVAIGIGAYMEYPTGSRFGGIPVGPFTFWSVAENFFSQFDQPGDPPGPYHIEPKITAFLGYGALPIGILWLGYFAIQWVRRGFVRAEA